MKSLAPKKTPPASFGPIGAGTLKKLSITIDKTTWPTTTGAPPFPTKFTAGHQEEPIEVSRALLLIGHLTTPTLASGVSLSEFWAWVRYYYAIAATNDLRLTKEYSDLDPHQKTILSDDFGMGIPMMWLIKPLDLVAWCDGRDFAARYTTLTQPKSKVIKKRGPAKSPDFVCLDKNGKLHVIECKGTQTSLVARANQVTNLNSKGEAGGGMVQKRSLKIVSNRLGQSLVCALHIGRIGGTEASDLLIVDPEGEEEIVVGEGQNAAADDSIIRSTTARCLRAAGLPYTAETMVSPSGTWVGARTVRNQKPTSAQRRQMDYVAGRRDRADNELVERAAATRIEFNDEKLVGRVVAFDLPRPLQIGRKTFTKVEIRQGIRPDIINELMGGALDDGLIGDAAPWLGGQLSGIEMSGEGGFAQLEIGKIYRSQIRLMP